MSLSHQEIECERKRRDAETRDEVGVKYWHRFLWNRHWQSVNYIKLHNYGIKRM